MKIEQKGLDNFEAP